MLTTGFRPRLALAISLIVISGLAAPASNAASGSARHPDLRLPDRIAKMLPPSAASARVRMSGGTPIADQSSRAHAPTTRIAQALNGKKANDPRAMIEAEQSFLEDAWGARVDDLRSRLHVRARTTTSAAQSDNPESTDRWGLPIDDITGDHLKDVLGVEITYDPYAGDLLALSFTGIRGTDGNAIWSHPVPTDIYDAFFLPAVGDLSGDGRADVVVLELFLDGDGCTVSCSVSEQQSWHWQMDVVSGADGSQLWGRRFDGSYDATGVGVVGAGHYQFTSNEYVVVPFPYANHGSKLLIDELSASGQETWAGAIIVYEDIPQIQIATKASVLDGADGTSLYSRTGSVGNGFSFMLPGSGDGDLFWETFETSDGTTTCLLTCNDPKGSLTVERLNGSYARDWTNTFGNETFAWAEADPIGADLDGDGIGDLILFSGDYDAWRWDVVAGGTGTLLWGRPGGDDRIDVLGPLDNAPGDDLLVSTYSYDRNPLETLQRVSGATGETLLTTSVTAHQVQDGWSDGFSFVVGDADGDGVNDIGIDTIAFDYGGDDYGEQKVESGKTGQAIFDEQNAGSYLLPGGDVNGDGKADIAVFSDTGYDGGYVEQMRAITLPAGTTTWTRTDALPWDRYRYIQPAGNMFGNGQDFLGTTAQFNDDWSELSQIAGINGAAGQQLWIYGDDLPVVTPPAIGTGSISGVVERADAAPLAGMCVMAFDTLGDYVAYALTDQEGTYRLNGLDTGVFLVEFEDCDAGTYETQWYNNKPDFDHADQISVGDGAAIVGIDAVLHAVPPPVFYRAETKPYIAGGDGFAVDDCETSTAPGPGGACFALDGTERSASFSIADTGGQTIAGMWQFSMAGAPTDISLSSGYFCGSTEGVPVPPGAEHFWVLPYSANTGYCDGAGTPTTGTITTRFFQ